MTPPMSCKLIFSTNILTERSRSGNNISRLCDAELTLNKIRSIIVRSITQWQTLCHLHGIQNGSINTLSGGRTCL